MSGKGGLSLDGVLNARTELFEPSLDTFRNVTAKLYLKEGSKSAREKAYSIPLPLREPVNLK